MKNKKGSVNLHQCYIKDTNYKYFPPKDEPSIINFSNAFKYITCIPPHPSLFFYKSEGPYKPNISTSKNIRK